MSVHLTFHGAAGCVTGFCARLQTGGANVLIDCGMFQGPKALKALNYQDFPFDPRKLDAVLLTHAHLDHSGLLPKLVRAGFEGAIYATAGTRDLARIMLADAGEIQESEVEHLNRRNQQRGRPPVEPIYTARDVAPTLALFRTVKLDEEVEIVPGLRARYWEAGHILGSASIEVTVDGEDGPQRLLFSGDLGPGGREYARDPQGPAGVDHLILESTYGDRERPRLDNAARRRMLAQELRDAHAAGGPVLIPAFAVERSQELLADIVAVMEQGDVPEGDIFLDSPLAIEATEVFLRRGWNKDAGRNPFETIQSSKRIRFLEKPWDSDGLDRLTGWHLIVAGSGMCDAGRVRKHLKRLLWRREATVLITGFQASGSLGRLLVEGREVVRIQGDEVRVRARIRALDIYSGHADAAGLVAWATARQPIAGNIFLAHGEPSSLAGLSRRLQAAGVAGDRLLIPALDQGFNLGKRAAEALPAPPPRLPAEAATALDWHNARAAFLGDLNERLEAAAGDAERMGLLRRLAAELSPAG
ncbi:MAG TPA: MBL fold metallo-hydrolase [Caulobacteraceae bacterium]|jgi:metallo-beta-lactamase family protein|nr:MBL fold metallo-hydrolase [Caulobacteraceae bacterium]